MKNTLKEKIEFCLNDASTNLLVPPLSYLKVFEKAATQSAADVGFGWEAVNKEKKVWVVNKIKMVFNKKIFAPFKGEFITWPVQAKDEKFSSYRDFIVKDDKKNDIAIGLSRWCLLDIENRSLCKISEVDHLIKAKLRADRVSDLPFVKVVKKDNAVKVYTFKVMLSDLDLNKHLNNKKYCEMATNVLTLQEFEKGINTFDISFNSECFFNDEIEIYRQENNSIIEIIGLKANKVVFSAAIKLF